MYLKTVCASLVMATLFCISDTQVVYGERFNPQNDEKVVLEGTIKYEVMSKDTFSYVMKNQMQKNRKTPPLVKASGELLPNYQARLQVLNKIHIVDLSGNKKKYESQKVYENGRLTQPIQLQINEYSQLMPIITMNGKGIRGIQRIMGPTGQETIGELISVWFNRNEQWELHDITFKSNGKKSYHYYEIE